MSFFQDGSYITNPYAQTENAYYKYTNRNYLTLNITFCIDGSYLVHQGILHL